MHHDCPTKGAHAATQFFILPRQADTQVEIATFPCHRQFCLCQIEYVTGPEDPECYLLPLQVKEKSKAAVRCENGRHCSVIILQGNRVCIESFLMVGTTTT